MQPTKNQTTFIIYAGLLLVTFYLLSPILTPFIFSFLLAYLTNPLVLRLDKYKLPHLLSVTIVFTLTFSFFIFIILMIIPLVYTQVTALLDALPSIILWLQTK